MNLRTPVNMSLTANKHKRTRTEQTSILTSFLNSKRIKPRNFVERQDGSNPNGYFYKFDYEESKKNLRPNTEENSGSRKNKQISYALDHTIIKVKPKFDLVEEVKVTEL